MKITKKRILEIIKEELNERHDDLHIDIQNRIEEKEIAIDDFKAIFEIAQEMRVRPEEILAVIGDMLSAEDFQEGY
jgi:hypothetical protein